MNRIISMINALSIIVSQCHYKIFRKVMVNFYRAFESIISFNFLIENLRLMLLNKLVYIFLQPWLMKESIR